MHSGVGLLLIAAAAGYWVLTLAAGQKGKVRKLGQYLGLFILVVSVVGTGCKLYYQWTCGPSGYYKGKWKGSYHASSPWGSQCPLTQKANPEIPPTSE